MSRGSGDRLATCHITFLRKPLMHLQLTQDFRNQPAGQRVELADPDARALIAKGIAEPVDQDDGDLAPLLTQALDDSLERAFQRWQQPRSSARAPFAGLGDGQTDDPR